MNSKEGYEKEEKDLSYSELKGRGKETNKAYAKKEAKKEGAEVKTDTPIRAAD